MLNPTYTEVLSAYTAYPAPIRPYLLRGETHPVLREKLTKSFMRAFIDLLSRANISNPARPIWVRVDTTAKRLGISSKTVSRTIALMTKHAWIRPNEDHDGRNWQGKYAGREFILSTELRKMVGLPVEDPRAAQPGVPGTGTGGAANVASPDTPGEPASSIASAHAEFEGTLARCADDTKTRGNSLHKSIGVGTEMSDGSTGYQQKQVKNPADQTKMSHGHIGVNNVFLKKEAPLKRDAFVIETQGEKTIRIPADLAEMHTVFGISGKGICALMRLAKAQCQRLQDVWKAKKEQLAKAGATGGRAVLYLRRLLSCGEDFAYVARNMTSAPAGLSELAPSLTGPHQTPPGTAKQPDTCDAGDDGDSSDSLNLRALAKACEGRKFRHISNGMTVRFYDCSADISRGHVYEVYAGWEMMRGLYLGVERGNLIEIRD
jgi:hypothetical protein